MMNRVWRWRWLLGAGLLAGLGSLPWLTPCGCLGMDFWRPKVASVSNLIEGCAVLRTPSPWLGKAGEPLAPNWDDKYHRDEWRQTNYEVWRSAKGLIVGMTVPGSDVHTRNAFRVDGGRLVPVTAADWQLSSLLPYAKDKSQSEWINSAGGNKGSVADLGGFVYEDIWGQRVSLVSEFEAFFMYRGQKIFRSGGLFALPCELEDCRPWVVQRTGMIVFFDLRTKVYREYSRVGKQPVEFTICGREHWMRAVSGWHGTVFTMPLSRDGENFLLCDFSQVKAGAI